MGPHTISLLRGVGLDARASRVLKLGWAGNASSGRTVRRTLFPLKAGRRKSVRAYSVSFCASRTELRVKLPGGRDKNGSARAHTSGRENRL